MKSNENELRVFSIFLNNNKGLITICSETEESALDYFKNNSNSPIVERDIDLEDVNVDIYYESNIKTTLKSTSILNYVIGDL